MYRSFGLPDERRRRRVVARNPRELAAPSRGERPAASVYADVLEDPFDVAVARGVSTRRFA
jgi:hypothetical protein